MTQSPSRLNRRLVLAAVIAAMFMAAVEGTIVATAMPTIVAALGGFDLYAWVFGAYLLPQATGVPIYGRLADLYGRKRVFCLGAGLFLTGSLLCGFAWNMPSLIVFRACQGLGAGAIMPMVQTIIADLYPSTERAKVQSWLGSVWGISAIIGPALGAALVQDRHWSLVFWVNLPIGAVAIGLVGICLHERLEAVEHRLDLAGAGLMSLATATLMLALLQGAQLGWWSAPLLAVSLVAGLLLIRQEKRAPEPMLPPELWANPTLRVAALGNLAIGALMIGVIAFMPTSIQGVLQRGAFDSALGLALLSLGWPITGWFAARMIIRVPYRTVATAGGVVLVVSTVLLLVARGEWGFALICAGALANGLGFGLISLTMLLAVQASVGWQLRGIATSSVIFMRTVGQALGTALLGALLNLGLARRLPGADDPVALLMDPLRRAALPAAELTRLVAAVAFSMQDVYLGLLVLALALFGCARLMPTGTLAEAQPYRPVDGAAATRHIRPSR